MKKRWFLLGGLLVLLGVVYSCTIERSKNNPVASGMRNQKYRPQFHFTPKAHWMNDPNGMVYYKGEYHLFFQYYPGGTVWGPMHWGHAVSKDLVHWKQLPIALYPDSLGYIFSGSAVIDWNNTSGFGTKNTPPMVAVYTIHNPVLEKEGKDNFQSQGIAYSTDKGSNWTKYKNNPVLPNPGFKDFRDPKVRWNNSIQKWIMVLAVHDHVQFYSSPDLKHWTFESSFGKISGAHGGVWECPDLFPLKINGVEKWVLIVSVDPGAPNGGSGTQYFIGDFDGHKFVDSNPPSTVLWVDWGKDDYAGVTWSDIPQADGRTIFLGWMSNWQYAQQVPTSTWRGTNTIPRTLQLKYVNGKIRLVSNPIEELKSLRADSCIVNDSVFTGSLDLSKKIPFNTSTVEVSLELKLNQNSEFGDSNDFGLKISNSDNEYVLAGYDASLQKVYVDRSHSGNTDFSPKFTGKLYAPVKIENGILKLHLFIDLTSIELFAQDGQTVMSDIFFPTQNFDKISLYANHGHIRIVSCKVYQLKSIW